MNYVPNELRACGRALLPAVHQLRDEHLELGQGREIRQRQAGQLPADAAPLGVRLRTQCRLQERGVPRPGRLGQRVPIPASSSTTESRRRSLRGQAELECGRLQGRYRPLQRRRRWRPPGSTSAALRARSGHAAGGCQAIACATLQSGAVAQAVSNRPHLPMPIILSAAMAGGSTLPGKPRSAWHRGTGWNHQEGPVRAP